jgi:predicted RNA polymerase sigma factor
MPARDDGITREQRARLKHVPGVPATRADLLRTLGRTLESRAAHDNAIELAGNTAEAAYLTRRRDQLG